MQFIFLGAVLVLYGFLNFYIGLRGWQSISTLIPINHVIYWGIIIIVSMMFFADMLLKKYLPVKLERVLNTIGGYWLAAFVYLLSFVVIIDIFRLIGSKLNIMPDILKNNAWFAAFAVILIVAVTLAAGTYYAIVPRTTQYDIAIGKKAGSMTELRCAMISDVHLGEIVRKDRLKAAVEHINSLEPDIVVFTGDLFDNSVEAVARDNMLEELKGINSKFGAYAIMGNHEHYSGSVDVITRMIESNGVTVLRDKVVKINDSFYLAGREDKAGRQFGFGRVKLDTLLDGTDKSLPVIVLDHQPSGLDEPRKAGIDLQLSGHTHGGQFFPVSLITDRIFEEDNGYLPDGKFNLVVSSGYGTWGPTVRLGSQSEIVDLKIKFSK